MSKRLLTTFFALIVTLPGIANACCGYGDDSSGDSFGYSDGSSSGFGSSGYGSDSGPGSFGGTGDSWGSPSSGYGSDSGPGSFGNSSGWGSPSTGYGSSGYSNNSGPGSFGSSDNTWGSSSGGYEAPGRGTDSGPGSFGSFGNTWGSPSTGYESPAYGADSGPGTFGGSGGGWGGSSDAYQPSDHSNDSGPGSFAPRASDTSGTDSYSSAFPSDPQGGSGGIQPPGYGGSTPGYDPDVTPGGALTPGGAGTTSDSRDFGYGDRPSLGYDGASGDADAEGTGRMGVGSIGETMGSSGTGTTNTPGTIPAQSDRAFGYADRPEETGRPGLGYSDAQEDAGRPGLGSSDSNGSTDAPPLGGSIGATLGRTGGDTPSSMSGSTGSSSRDDMFGYRDNARRDFGYASQPANSRTGIGYAEPRPAVYEQIAGLDRATQEAKQCAKSDYDWLLGEICFVAGTPVHTKDGLKPIKEIKVGDLVASRDEHTGETAWKPVVQLFRNEAPEIVRITLVDEDGNTEEIGATPEHPFWVEGRGWTNAGLLNEAFQLTANSNQPITVLKVTKDYRNTPTFNIEVDDYHSYFVAHAGVWVHNTCRRGSPTIVEDTARGRASQRRVLEDYRGIYSSANPVEANGRRSIPDAVSKFRMIEIKDTKRVYYSRQLRTQTAAAAQQGLRPVLITGKNTYVSAPARKAFLIIRRTDLGP